MDYNGNARITGGAVFAAGTSGMMQTFGEDSLQNYLVIYWEKEKQAGDVIRLTDQKGEVLGEYAPEKNFDTAILSVPGLENGSVYQIVSESSNGEENEIIEMQVTGVETVYGTPADGGKGFGGHGGSRRERDRSPKPPEGKENFKERDMSEKKRPSEPPKEIEGFKKESVSETDES